MGGAARRMVAKGYMKTRTGRQCVVHNGNSRSVRGRRFGEFVIGYGNGFKKGYRSDCYRHLFILYSYLFS